MTERTNKPRRRLPFVLINMAMSADGKIATANRRVTSIGSRRDHDHLLELRATVDAVMAGARTVDSESVTLGAGGLKYRRRRLRHNLSEYPLRVIVSGTGSIAPNAEIFRHRFAPIVIFTAGKISPLRLKRMKALADDVHISGEREIDFPDALEWLRRKWNVRRLLCEGGGELNDAVFRAGVARELNLTLCPKIIGGRHAPTIADGIGFPSLRSMASLRLKKRRFLNGEMFLVYEMSAK